MGRLETRRARRSSIACQPAAVAIKPARSRQDRSKRQRTPPTLRWRRRRGLPHTAEVRVPGVEALTETSRPDWPCGLLLGWMADGGGNRHAKDSLMSARDPS